MSRRRTSRGEPERGHSRIRNESEQERSHSRLREDPERERSHSRTKRPRRTASPEQHNEEPSLRHEIDTIKDTMTTIQATLLSMQQTVAPPNMQPIPQTATPSHMQPIPQTTETQTSSQATTVPPPQGNFDATILQAFQPMARPVLTAGVGITAHILLPTKEKIWRDEYIHLHQLLPQQANQYAETLTLSVCQDNQTNLGLRVAKPKPATMSLQQWEDAFLVYMAVYTERHLNCTPAMCTYMRDVKDMARRGANFLHYDEQFRLERATTHCAWDAVHQGLLFQATTPFRPFNNFAKSNYNQKPFLANKIPVGYCTNYNTKNTYCKNQPCRYKHLCPTCDEQHPIYRCNNRDRKSKQEPQQSKAKSANTKDSSSNK